MENQIVRDGNGQMYHLVPVTSGTYAEAGHRVRYASEGEKVIAKRMAEEWHHDNIRDLVIKEASQIIECIAEGKEFQALREFHELTIVMCAYTDHLADDIKTKAAEEAEDYYAKMFSDTEVVRRMKRS